MKVLLCVLVLVGVCSEGAMAARWEKAEVPVWDFTPEPWRPYVQASVDDFNANLPPEAPELVYIPMGELPCDALPKHGKRGGVSVCVGSSRTTHWAKTTTTEQAIVQAKIVLAIEDSNPGRAVCHEMTHATLGAPDDASYPHRDESCVQGDLDHLGPWDIAYAEQVYAHHPKHTRKHR